MDKKATLLVSISLLAATAACFSIVTATVSWFRTFENQDISGGGSTFNSYFAGGDGSEADPYQISNSTQMYNFAWLQYMGIFNKDADNNGVIDQQYYFVVNNDVDMSGMVIPPIGTVKNPFLGNFNGNDYVISNLTVSNEIDTTQITTDKIYYHPDGVTNLEGEAELGLYGPTRVVGFFGVIGTAKDLGTNLAYTYDTEVAKASNFYLDKTTVYTKSTSTLVGVVAGYVGAPHNPDADPDEQIAIVHDIGVYQCNINAKQNAVGLSSYGTTISKFSIVGDYSGNAIEWKSGESGQLDEFGGSIDILSLTRRINYMTTSSDTKRKESYYYFADDDDFNLSAHYQTDGFGYDQYYWKMTTTTNQTIAYLQDGTYLPINVNNEAMGLDVDTENLVSFTVSGTSYQNYTNNYYSTVGSSEIVKDTNTGYVVGAQTSTSTKMRVRIQAAGGLWKSLNLTRGTSRATMAAGSDVASMLRMVTYKGSNNAYVISDDQNTGAAYAGLEAHYSNYARFDSATLNLQRYESVKTNFSNSLAKTGMLHGIGPKAYLPDSNPADTYIQNGTDVTINDSTGKLHYDNYQFIKGGVNCSLNKFGFLTAVVGTYSTSQNQFAFDLYKLNRDADGNIIKSSYSLISSVYYDETTQTASFTKDNNNMIEVYNKNWYGDLPPYVAFYLEIPLPAGDYVIGDSASRGTSVYGSYFLYLDIGSNGGGGAPTSSFEFKIENVKFVATKGNLEDYKNVLFLLSFAGATHGEGSIFFKHNGLTPAEEIKISYTVMTVTPNTTITVTEDASASVWNNTL